MAPITYWTMKHERKTVFWEKKTCNAVAGEKKSQLQTGWRECDGLGTMTLNEMNFNVTAEVPGLRLGKGWINQ